MVCSVYYFSCLLWGSLPGVFIQSLRLHRMRTWSFSHCLSELLSFSIYLKLIYVMVVELPVDVCCI